MAAKNRQRRKWVSAYLVKIGRHATISGQIEAVSCTHILASRLFFLLSPEEGRPTNFCKGGSRMKIPGMTAQTWLHFLPCSHDKWREAARRINQRVWAVLSSNTAMTFGFSFHNSRRKFSVERQMPLIKKVARPSRTALDPKQYFLCANSVECSILLRLVSSLLFF